MYHMYKEIAFQYTVRALKFLNLCLNPIQHKYEHCPVYIRTNHFVPATAPVQAHSKEVRRPHPGMVDFPLEPSAGTHARAATGLPESEGTHRHNNRPW